MFQKIASICSIGSFLAAIYIILSGNPKWQWYSLFGIGLLLIIVALIDRKYKLAHSSKIITLKGVQPLPSLPTNTRAVEMEVFYPRCFNYSPNLTISFFQKDVTRGRVGPGVLSNNRPAYKLKEQRPDGFKLQISSLGIYKPIIKWQAKGVLEVRYKNTSKKNNNFAQSNRKTKGYIGGIGPTD